jgi:hypothetical protein
VTRYGFRGGPIGTPSLSTVEGVTVQTIASNKPIIPKGTRVVAIDGPAFTSPIGGMLHAFAVRRQLSPPRRTP